MKTWVSPSKGVMIYLLFVTATLLSIPLQGKGLLSDTIIYSSSFERVMFENLQRGDLPDAGLFLMYDGDSSVYNSDQKILDDFYSDVLGPRLKDRDDKARVKIIFNEVHDRFLTKYIDSASFSAIFKDKSYNCVSGSALYSVVLNHYNIPFEIREIPTHVYVIAYPKTYNILMESTNPRGLFAPSEKSMASRVDDLVEAGYMSKDYVNEVGPVKAFNEFFYSRDAINIQNLAGIQYWNGSIRDRVNKRYKTSLQRIEKADILFPGKRNKLFRNELLDQILGDSKFDNLEDVERLIKYCNIMDTERSRSNASNAFQTMVGRSLIRGSDEKFINSAYAKFDGQLLNVALKKEITRIYNMGFGHYYLMKRKFNESLAKLEPEYVINPNDVELQSLIANDIAGKIGPAVGNVGALKALNEYVLKYPFLESNPDIVRLYLFTYTKLAASNFVGDRESIGNKYLLLMEDIMAKFGKGADTDETVIGYAYAEAGAYYYRMRDNAKAIKWMERGLKYAPDHPEIKIRLQIVRDEIKKKP